MDSGYLLTFVRGQKFFELSNHLGNVLATVADRKIGVAKADGVTVSYDTAAVLSAQDYYPGGMQEPGRQYTTGTQYRYGFNGKEKSDEIEGTGVDYDYGMRIYDTRIGKFLSVDPLQTKFAYFTPYQFAGNSPIANVDLDGLEPKNSTTAALVGTSAAQKVVIEQTLREATKQMAKQAAKSGGEMLVEEGTGFVPNMAPALGGGVLLTFLVLSPDFDTWGKHYTEYDPWAGLKPKPSWSNNRWDPFRSPKPENDEKGVYIYETASSDKLASGLVGKDAGALPYFGITDNAVLAAYEGMKGQFVRSRYPRKHERWGNFEGIIGKTDRITALGVEAALIALNTYGKKFDELAATGQMSSADVMKSTQIDNKMFTIKFPLIVEKGIEWLNANHEGWRDTFYRPKNKTGPNHPENKKLGG